MTRPAKIADVHVGTILYPDGGFPCMKKNTSRTVYHEDKWAANLIVTVRAMIDAYDSDDGHGPIIVIEDVKSAIAAAETSSKLYVRCDHGEHMLDGQEENGAYVGLSLEPWP